MGGRLRLAHAGGILVGEPGYSCSADQWRRARDAADRLPGQDSDTLAKRVAARTSLCASAWRSDDAIADTGFDELRELCDVSGDKVSLAIGMSGAVTATLFDRRYFDAARMSIDNVALLRPLVIPRSSPEPRWRP